MKYRLISTVLCMLMVGSASWAEDGKKADAPAEGKKPATVEGAAENPAQFADLISDVKMAEGVNIFVEILGILEVQTPKAEVKNARIAIMTAYMFKKWAANARDLADSIAQVVAPELLPPIVAAAAVVMGNQAPIVTEAFVDRAPGGYTQILRNAGAHPETVLPQGLLVSIGLPVAHTVPATGREPTALPVAPPLKDVEGEKPPTPPPLRRTPSPEPPPPEPPPVPLTYPGQ